MPFDRLKTYLDHLESRGDLKRVRVEVDPELEITEIVTRVVREGGPALLFERVKGSRFPLAINVLGSYDRVEQILGMHLDVIRRLQDETGGFTAFIPWSYKREQTALGRKVEVEAGPNRYLRIIAASRLYLDNFQHIQASWFSEGKKTGVVALNFGGDDFGGTILDETVMQLAGHYNRTTVEEIIELIRDAGFTPAQRTTLYDVLREFPDGGAEETENESRVHGRGAG
jgi:hypothetical protein